MKDMNHIVSVSENNRKILIAIGVLAVIGVGLYGISSGILQAENTQTPTSDESSDNTTRQEVASQIDLSASEIEGDITKITITDLTVDPANPRISPEDGVRFVNNAGVDVKLNFSRNIQTFSLKAGESVIVDPKAIVYYDVRAKEDGADFRAPAAPRINVQG